MVKPDRYMPCRALRGRSGATGQGGSSGAGILDGIGFRGRFGRDGGLASLQVERQSCEVGRVQAADPPSLAEGSGADPCQFLAGFGAKLGDERVIEVGRKRLVFEPTEPLDLLGLTLNVPAVLRL